MGVICFLERQITSKKSVFFMVESSKKTRRNAMELSVISSSKLKNMSNGIHHYLYDSGNKFCRNFGRTGATLVDNLLILIQ